MRQTITKAIVLGRTNFGEADRILTLITVDQGKVRVLARGVRKEKSKLAGGVELLSVSEIGFLRGRGEIATLTTSRLDTHYGKIVNDVDRIMLAYELLKCLNKATEDNAGQEYFELIRDALSYLNELSLPADLVKLWFNVNLLKISGHSPNLKTDNAGSDLSASGKYHFDTSSMAFIPHDAGIYSAPHIKILRLANANSPHRLGKVEGINNYAAATGQLSSSMLRYHLHV